LKTATHWTSYWIELKTPYHQNKISPPDALEMDKLAQSFSVPGGCYHDASGQGESDPLVGHSTTACVVEDSQTPLKSTLLPMLLESMRHLWGRSISSEEMQRHGNLVNLDTTALVALVSELTNGGALALIQMTSEEREKQFPTMAKFVVDQVFPLYQQPSLFQSLGFSVSQKKHRAGSLDLKMVEELQVCVWKILTVNPAIIGFILST
jgi:hypothetical protein